MPWRASATVSPAGSERLAVMSSHSGATGKSGCTTSAPSVAYNDVRSSGTPDA